MRFLTLVMVVGGCSLLAAGQGVSDHLDATQGRADAAAQAGEGSIVGWGSQVVGVNLDNGFVAVAGGGEHSLGLKTDGSIVAWGRNDYGAANVPPPNTGFVAIDAGSWHSLGLKGDGSIVAWGRNDFGETDVPAPNTGFVSVAAGGSYSLGVKADGSIVAWGRNNYGQTNVPAPNTGFVAIAAGFWHSLGLKGDGSIVGWGANGSGQTNVPSPNTDFVAVAAGQAHSLGLKANGSVVAWGFNSSGQCNAPEPNAGFTGIAAGSNHSLGRKLDGSIVAWGLNNYGQANVPAPNTGFAGIAGGAAHSLGLKGDGSIVAWGDNEEGQTNIPPPNADFIAVAAGGDHSLGLRSNGSIAAWGWNDNGQCNIPLPNSGFAGIAAGYRHSLGLKGEGSIVAWGSNSYGQLNVPAPNTGFIAVAAGEWHSVGLKADGSVVAWGENYDGQTDVPSPNADFAAVAAGDYHTLGVKADGSIVTWGCGPDHNYDQCDVPASNTGFVSIAAGRAHSLGLKADGSVVAWGANYDGQTDVPSPNADFVAVAAGKIHSLGLKANGSIVAWGWNYYGQTNIPPPNAGFLGIAGGAGRSLGIKERLCFTDDECNDGNPCTDHWCDMLLGCQRVNDDTNACGDALFCNGAEDCNAGACLPGAFPCSANEVCVEEEDRCAPDCNGNAADDQQDITSETSPDCNDNDIPDECEIDEGSSAPGGPFFCDPVSPPVVLGRCDPDCDRNGVPDRCDVPPIAPNAADCNANGIPDICDTDCQPNGVPDECEIVNTPFEPTTPVPLNSNAISDVGNDAAPRVVTDGRGIWLSTWESTDDLGGTIGTDTDILFARSLDNGATWSPPAALNTNAGMDNGSDEFSYLATDGEGTWVAVWCSTDDLGGTVGDDVDILSSCSRDGGATWTAPLPVNSNAYADTAEDRSPKIATDGNGSWIVVWVGSWSGADWDILLATSTDPCTGWGARRLLNANGNSDGGDDLSPAIATDGRGIVAVVWDSPDSLDGTLGPDKDILISRSVNGGATWSYPEALNTTAASDGLIDRNPSVASNDAGIWIAVWQQSLTEWISEDIVYARSADYGLSWTAPTVLHVTDSPSGYGDQVPNVVAGTQGVWVVAWRSDDTLGGTIGPDNDILFSRTSDDGSSWSPALALNTNASSDTGSDSSPSARTDMRGNWVVVWHSSERLSPDVGQDMDILVTRFSTSRSGDCNRNGTLDECDIADGRSFDRNANGVPDECELAIPAVSQWGMVILALFVLVSGSILCGRRTTVPMAGRTLGVVSLLFCLMYTSASAQPCGHPPQDQEYDADVDLGDFKRFVQCLTGPLASVEPGCVCFMEDADSDVDLRDFARFQNVFGWDMCLVANPSFELPGRHGNLFAGWYQFGQVGLTQEMVPHGTAAAELTGPAGEDWAVSGLWQKLTRSCNEPWSDWVWSASVYVGHDPANPLTGGSRAILNVEWYAKDQSHGYESHTVADACTPPGTMRQAMVSVGPAPEGTDNLHLLVGVLQDPNEPPAHAFFDLVALNPPTLDDRQWEEFRSGRSVEFSGRSWRVKGWRDRRYDPGDSPYGETEQHVWVDQQHRLHLTVRQIEDQLYSTEVALDDALGYGDYIVTTVGPLNSWDPHVVLGIFLYQYMWCWRPQDMWWNPTNEIDIEFSHWGNPSDDDVGQFAVQPHNFDPDHRVRFPISAAEGQLTSHAFRWLPDRVEFRSWYGDAGQENCSAPVHAWTYPIPGQPPLHVSRPEQPRLHINFWRKRDSTGSPMGWPDHEIVIDKFTFVPTP